jgi:phosphate transport system protein
MTIREERLAELRQLILKMGTLAEEILERALQAVWDRDSDLGKQVQVDDLEIDRLDLEIDEAVLEVLALQAPVAEDRRRGVANILWPNDLERVGDLARNIGKSAIRLAGRKSVPFPPALEREADSARKLLSAALDSFTSGDASLARGVIRDDEAVDDAQDRVVLEAIEKIGSSPEIAEQEIDFILIAKNLERVADHATNIAEDVVLVTEAENLKHADKLREADRS